MKEANLRGARRSLAGRLGLGLALIASLTCQPSPAGAAAAHPHSNTPAVSPANAAATHAYLVAENAYEEAELANLPQEIAAREATAARISEECPGILTNAPPHEEVLAFGLVGPRATAPASRMPPSARAEGERRRQSRQLSELKTELSFALSESLTQPDRESSAALVRAFTPLRWSNPYVTLFVQTVVATAKEALEIPTPAVCADMTSWVASGYRTLTAASRAIAGRLESLLKRDLELVALAGRLDATTPADIFAPYENASDRALARHTKALKKRLHKESDTQAAVLKRLEATVGLPAEKAPKEEQPKNKPVVIARGKTAAGGSFVAKVEPSSQNRAGGCIFVTVTESSRPTSGLAETLSGEGTDRCLHRSHVSAEPTVHCDSGLLTIEANLLAKTRSVRLLLSDGGTITSPAIRVPARLGGPAGLYYQAVRGSSPIPVSLTELDASGNVLAVLKLPAVVECTKHPVKHLGNVLLIHESPPQAPAFTIRAERFRKLGVEHFELKFADDQEERLFGSEGGGLFEASVEGRASTSLAEFLSEPRVPTFAAARAPSGCEPQPYTIIYGLLKAPRDTVLARVSGQLVALRKVVIPARLHAGGVLAYGAFSPLPTELLTRAASGKTVSRINLAEAAKSYTETCESEAE